MIYYYFENKQAILDELINTFIDEANSYLIQIAVNGYEYESKEMLALMDHYNPRSKENLRVLKDSDPEGCFISKVEGKIVTYIFSKTFGKEGFLRSIGVYDYQGKGIGKALMEKSIYYLKTKCYVIGLEVLP